jgi:hypothetical protein
MKKWREANESKIEISDLRFPRYGCVVVADCNDVEEAAHHYMNNPEVGLFWHESDTPDYAEAIFFVIVPLETASP